jgi:hypothetical protein
MWMATIWRSNAVMYVTVPYNNFFFSILYFFNQPIGSWFLNCPRTFVLWWQSCCIRGRADRARPRTQHDCHHDTKVKPKAATAVIKLLIMGGTTPETRWAVNKRQDNKLENCCIWLVIYLICTMTHGLPNLKFSSTKRRVYTGTDQAVNRVRCFLQYFSICKTLYFHVGECYDHGSMVCDAVYFDSYGRICSSFFRVGSLLFCPKHSPVSSVRQGLRLYKTNFNFDCSYIPCRSQWPRSLRRRFAAACLLRSWARIQPGAWMFVFCECCMLSLRRADHSSRGVLPTVVRRCVWSRKPQEWGGHDLRWVAAPQKKVTYSVMRYKDYNCDVILCTHCPKSKKLSYKFGILPCLSVGIFYVRNFFVNCNSIM